MVKVVAVFVSMAGVIMTTLGKTWATDESQLTASEYVSSLSFESQLFAWLVDLCFIHIISAFISQAGVANYMHIALYYHYCMNNH